MYWFLKNYYFYPTQKTKTFMKKMIPVAAIAVIALMFTSCKKDYTCTCTVTVTGSAATTTSTSVGKTTKSDAQSKCDQIKTVYTTPASSADCHI